MDKGYVLECFDTLVNVTFNPQKATLEGNISNHKKELFDLVLSEKEKVQSSIAKEVFNLHDEGKIRCAINNYHAAMVVMLDQALINKDLLKEPFLQEIMNEIITSLEGLLYFIKSRFHNYLNEEERAPVTYLAKVRDRLTKRLEELVRKFRQQKKLQPILVIIRDELKIFFSFPLHKHIYSLRSLFYIKDLIARIEHLKLYEDDDIYSELDHLLICMNFNSSGYIHFLKQKIAAHVNRGREIGERKQEWLFLKKQFKQFYSHSDLAFSYGNPSLKKRLDTWFMQEIFFLEKEVHQSEVPFIESKKPVKEKPLKVQKLRSKLSVDQMALILRAADDMRIIIARSLSSVFKAIAPHLSSPQRKDISFDSMRSKAYSAELRDKEIAIHALEEIIDKIKEY